jgi:hypothetical protein
MNMPTILIEDGFRLFFYSNENSEPPHVHVEKGSAVAKFWINPSRLAVNYGMKGSDLNKAGRIVRKHEKMIKERWNAFFSKKK